MNVTDTFAIIRQHCASMPTPSAINVIEALFAELLNQYDNDLATVSHECQLLSARVTQFDDTARQVAVLGDRIAERVARQQPPWYMQRKRARLT